MLDSEKLKFINYNLIALGYDFDDYGGYIRADVYYLVSNITMIVYSCDINNRNDVKEIYNFDEFIKKINIWIRVHKIHKIKSRCHGL